MIYNPVASVGYCPKYNNGVMKSFQLLIAAVMNIAVKIGTDCGNIILKNTVQCPAPSMNAASAYDHGIPMKKLYKMSKSAVPKPPMDLIKYNGVLSKCKSCTNL